MATLNPGLVKAVGILGGLSIAALLLWLNFKAIQPKPIGSTASVEQRLNAARVWQYHPSGALEYHLTTRLMERKSEYNDQHLTQPFTALYDIEQRNAPPFTLSAQSGVLFGQNRQLHIHGQIRGERDAFDAEPRWVLSTDEIIVRETDHGMLAESNQQTSVSAINIQQQLLSITESAGFRLHPDTGQIEQFGGVQELITPAATQTGTLK